VPQVQEAFGTRGATPNPLIENIALDVIGYNRTASAVPEPSTYGLAFGICGLMLIAGKRIRPRNYGSR